jgi:dihydrofolate reductase
MRKLKLQIHLSVDGYAADKDMKPIFTQVDDELKNHSIANIEEVDCIILGRKTAVDFIPYWASVPANHSDYTLARRINEIPKIIFTKTLMNSQWTNTKIAMGEISEEINQLKKQAGKNIIVYGGCGFVSSLIKEGLIDEYHLLVCPVALGNGLSIFDDLKNELELKLVNSKSFDCGIVLLHYEPKRNL